MDAIPAAAPALNPWTRIWIRPRATIRHLAHTDPKRHVTMLAILGGVAQALIQMMDSGAGEELSLPAIFALSLAVGPVLGLLALYVGAALLRWRGRWIGGRASAQEIRLRCSLHLRKKGQSALVVGVFGVEERLDEVGVQEEPSTRYGRDQAAEDRFGVP